MRQTDIRAFRGRGAKSSSAVLARFEHLGSIPNDAGKWKLKATTPGRAACLAESLSGHREEALLNRKSGARRKDVPIKEKLSDSSFAGSALRTASAAQSFPWKCRTRTNTSACLTINGVFLLRWNSWNFSCQTFQSAGQYKPWKPGGWE